MINASAERLYDLVSDLPRMGEWSPENTGGEWEGDIGCVVGARFYGTNRRDDREWTTRCEIRVADRPHEVSWSVLALPIQPKASNTHWTYRFTQKGDATEVEERRDLLELTPRYLALSPEEQLEHVNHIREVIERTLRNLKEFAERTSDSTRVESA